MAKFGLTRNRYHYLRAKIHLCASLLTGSYHDMERVTSALRPSLEELELVDRNLSALKRIVKYEVALGKDCHHFEARNCF
jgi:hypothetical protein